jgi:hypothetical protein
MHNLFESIDRWFFGLALEKQACMFSLTMILVGCIAYLCVSDLASDIANYKRRIKLEKLDEFEYRNDLY